MTCVVADTTLDLSNGGLTSVPDITDTSLLEVRLDNNNITEIDAFPTLPFLGDLDVRFNKLTEFPNLVNISLSLENLHLGNNLISYIDKDRIAILIILRHLDLNNNLISHLPEAGLPLLGWVDLGSNLFHHCPIFHKVSLLLRDIYIYSNTYLFRCPTKSFLSLAGLRHVDMSSNYALTEVPVFSPSLNVLYMSSTSLGDLKDGAFSYLQNLNHLQLDSTQVSRIPNLLMLPQSLITLSLMNNTGIQCTDPMLPWVKFMREAGKVIHLNTISTCFGNMNASSAFETGEQLITERFKTPSDKVQVTIMIHLLCRIVLNMLFFFFNIMIIYTFSESGGAVSMKSTHLSGVVAGLLPIPAELVPYQTPLQCARLCLSTPSCLMFYMATGDSPGCQLTDGNTGGTTNNINATEVYFNGV